MEIASVRRALFFIGPCWLRRLTLFLCLTAALAAGGQPQYILDSWTTENGAPTDRINGLIQGKDGFLWLATYEGLIRFDGHDYQLYNHQEHSALLGGLMNIFQAESGAFWMLSTSGNLLRLEKGAFTAWGKEEGFPTDAGLILRENPKGELVFWGSSNFWVIGNDDQIQRLPTPGFEPEPLRDFAYGADGTLWIAPRSGGLVGYKDGTLIEIDPSTRGAEGNRVTAILPVDEDQFVLGLQGGAGRFFPDTGDLRFIPEPTFDRQDRNLIISENPSDGIRILGNALGHLFSLEGDVLNPLTLGPYGDPNETINAICTLQEGGFAVATYSQGLVMLAPAAFPFYNEQTGLNADLINSISKIEEGHWLVAHSKGIHRFDGDSHFEPLMVKGQLFQDYAVSAFIDSKKRIWIATLGSGIHYRDASGWHVIDRNSGLATNTGRCFAEDSEGNIWIGTRLGLYKWNGEILKVFNQANGLRSDYILSLHIDKEDTVWVGMAQTGIQKIVHGNIFQVLNQDQEDKFESRTIFSIRPDTHGDLWCGITGGIAHIVDGKARYIPLFSHLDVDSVYHVIDDTVGFLWLSSSNGFHRIPYQTLANPIEPGLRIDSQVRTFSKKDGLPTSTMRAVSKPFQEDNGRIWMPTEKGFFILDPRNIPQRHAKSSPYFDRISVNDETVLGGWHFQKANLDLPPGVRRLSFTFSAPSFSASGRDLLRFRLRGFDVEWRTTSSRLVEYTNLPPGEYVFELQPAHTDEAQNLKMAVASLRIAPRFNESAWFYPSLVGLILLVAFAASFWRTHAMKTQQMRLSQLVEERTREIRENQLKLDQSNKKLKALSEEMAFFLGVAAHDLRNPIGNIESLAMLMQAEVESIGSEKLKTFNAAVLFSAKQTRELLGNLLDLNRIESGRTAVKLADICPEKLLKSSTANFAELAREKSIQIAHHVDSPVPRIKADPDLLQQVVENLLSNAVKFSMPDTQIDCRIFSLNDTVIIEVADQGLGIPASEHDRVFKKFPQLTPRPTMNESSTGLGLSIVKKLTELMGGKISFTSAEGKGTTFRLDFPKA